MVAADSMSTIGASKYEHTLDIYESYKLSMVCIEGTQLSDCRVAVERYHSCRFDLS